MVFPVESEDRTMRSLLMLCQDNALLIVEAFRKVLAIIDTLIKEGNNPSDVSMEQIDEIHDQASGIRTQLIDELHDIGSVLVNREDFYRLISAFGELMDHIDAAAIRLIEISKRGWVLPKKAAGGFAEMSDLAFDSLLKFREAMMSLGFNSEKALGFTREVDEIERKIDDLYVKVDIDIIMSGAELPLILILKDVTSLIENMVDLVRETSDLIRIIAT